MKVLGKQLSKGAVAAILLITIVVSSAAAWDVISDAVVAGGKFTVKKASAEVGNAGWIIDIPALDSGEEFSGSGDGSITIINAKELVVWFTIDDLDEDEQKAIASGKVRIYESGVWEQFIDLTDPKLTSTVVLEKGSHVISIEVAGVAGYPAAETPIEFHVMAQIATP